MIDINKFYIREDGKAIIIDVSIKDSEYFENVYLNTIELYDLDGNELYRLSVVTENIKHKELVLTKDDVSLVNVETTIFKLKVTTIGTPSPSTPCGEDVDEVKAYTYYKGTLYNMMLNYLKELNVNCTIPQGFIDSMLKFKGVDVALNTDNPELAKDLWDRIINNTTNSVVSSNCGCHG